MSFQRCQPFFIQKLITERSDFSRHRSQTPVTDINHLLGKYENTVEVPRIKTLCII